MVRRKKIRITVRTESRKVVALPKSSGDVIIPESSGVSELRQARLDLDGFLERSTQKGGRGLKRKWQFDFEELAKELMSNENGFLNEKLMKIWKLVSQPDEDFPVGLRLRKKILFSMLPAEKVSKNIVHSMMYWLKNATANKFKPSFVDAVYQLLTIYAEKQLTEPGALMDEFVLTCILTADAGNSAIHWKTRLFQLISTPTNVQKLHVEQLGKLLDKNLRKTQIADVKKALLIASHSSEDMFDETPNPILGRRAALKFPKEVNKLMPRFQSKMTAYPVSSPLAIQWPRDSPANRADIISCSQFVQMMDFLQTDEGALEVAFSPGLFSLYEQGMKDMLYFGFRVVDSDGKLEEDMGNINIIFRAQEYIMKAKKSNVDIFNQWLVRVIPHWDFTTFKTTFFKFIPHVDPQTLGGRFRLSWSKKFSAAFFNAPGSRSEIWEALQKLFFNWMTKAPTDDQYLGGLKWLAGLMEQCVYTLLRACDDPADNPMLFYKIVAFYQLMLEQSRDINNLSCIRTIPLALTEIAIRSNNAKAMEVLQDLFESNSACTTMWGDGSFTSNYEEYNSRRGLVN